MSDGTTSLEGEALLVTQLELVTPTSVAGTFYGIAFTLFCLYVHALAPRLRSGDRKRQAMFMLVCSTIIMICGLYYLVANAWVTQNAYIKHSDYPGGPFVYVELSYLATPVILAGLVCQVTVDILTAAIQVWRVWVIWSATQYAIFATVLPALCGLTFAGLRLRTVVLDSTLSFEELVQVDTITQKAESTIQGVTTILCTVLISLYLIFKQWQQRKLIGKDQGSTGYVNVVTMLVESYAIESIWQLILVIIWDRAESSFFAESSVYIEIIAYFLVQYRVARGKAYESQREQRKMSSLHWNRSNHATTQFTEAGEIQASHRVSAVPEAPYAPRVSSQA